MVKQITKGIKISVKTNFEGTYKNANVLNYAFSCQIDIENQSKDTVQLQSRYWLIRDSLNDEETIIGEGVIGKKPVINPGETYTYSSGCVLKSSLGSMQGFYTMTNLSTSKKFEVAIPSFKLVCPYAIN